MDSSVKQELQQAPKTNVLSRYFKMMPVIFPLAGLFHGGLAFMEASSYIGDDTVSSLYLLRPLILFLYFVFWIAVCFAKRWGAIAYILLSVANVSFYLFGADTVLKHAIGDLLFVPIPVNLLFSFLLLFYFKKLK